MKIASNPHMKKDPKTHLSIDLPFILKELRKTADEPPWRPCQQCGHPFSRMNDVCPKCGKNQKRQHGNHL
jgi:rubrerythrin